MSNNAENKLTVWETRWLNLAKFISSWSKDPSTQVGAVLAKDNRLVSFGFNGFPQKISDDGRLNESFIKHKIVLHAEENALMFAEGKTKDCIAYVFPLHPCPHCASRLIQAGISKVIFSSPTEDHKTKYDFDFVMGLFAEAGIETVEVSAEDF